jgi:hypothetical protein
VRTSHVLALAAAAFVLMLGLPAFGQSQTASDRLARRVSSLERQNRVLAKQLAQLQRGNRIQAALNLVQNSRINDLEKGPTVSEGLPSSRFIPARSSARVDATCTTGTVIGGTFSGNPPVYPWLTALKLVPNGFSATAFNQAGAPEQFFVRAICLS